MPGRGKDMGDGWETKRRRDPGPDWSIIKLADKGSVEKVIIDTCHFKGNFPDSFMLQGLVSDSDDFIKDHASLETQNWQTIIEKKGRFTPTASIYLLMKYWWIKIKALPI
ncbi:MAG: hypothetical protein Q9M92_02385 [Enterobacterales bacterium]|nr:hypothetical protein [Enterobacterales bacterium]